MNYQSALEYLQEISKSGSRLGLSRLEKLLTILHNPQKDQKYIHIAGTNGKGSTAMMISSILSAAGYKTGLFTSPYLMEVNEQIRINGQRINNEEFAKACKVLKEATLQMEPCDLPTEFELLTALAFLHFKQQKCDIVVLETGMGGRFDATNVIDETEVCVLTNIGMDHVQVLGSTIAQITENKAGIIRKNSKVVCYEQEEEALKVIRDAAKENNASLTIADFSSILRHEEHLSMQKFSYKEYKEISLPLIGEYQRKNAAVALETITELKELGYKISMEAVKQGMFQVSWPARFEILFKKPLVILDGGHNSQCTKEVMKVLERYAKDKKIIFVMGVLSDKDYDKMLDLMIPHAKIFYTVTPQNKRALKANQLAEIIKNKNAEAVAQSSVEQGVMAALNQANTEDVICITGSLYMAGQVRNCFF